MVSLPSSKGIYGIKRSKIDIIGNADHHCAGLGSRVGARIVFCFEIMLLGVSCSEVLTSWFTDQNCVVSDPASDAGRGWWFEVRLLERSFASVRPPSSVLQIEKFRSVCVGTMFQAFP